MRKGGRGPSPCDVVQAGSARTAGCRATIRMAGSGGSRENRPETRFAIGYKNYRVGILGLLRFLRSPVTGTYSAKQFRIKLSCEFLAEVDRSHLNEPYWPRNARRHRQAALHHLVLHIVSTLIAFPSVVNLQTVSIFCPIGAKLRQSSQFPVA
jgi:hypothetical protein